MPNWQGSNRRSELPKDWRSKVRPRIFQRDGYQCRHVSFDGFRCREVPTDVDHIGDKWDHSDENLRSLCDRHHSHKTGQQGAAAAHKKRKEINQRFRRTEVHPSLQ